MRSRSWIGYPGRSARGLECNWSPPRCPLPTRLHARPTGTTNRLRDRWRIAEQAAGLWTDLLRLRRVPQPRHCAKQRNTLILGSPTRARTWDLRINRLSQSCAFLDTYARIRPAITANLRSAKALLPWFRLDLRNRIQWRLDNRNDYAEDLWRFPFGRRVRG